MLVRIMRNKKNHKIFCIAGIKNLLKRNYKMPTDLINLKDEVDSTLTMPENWFNIKEKFLIK